MQHGRHARRGREAAVEGEDLLARRVQRAASLAESDDDSARNVAGFLASWHGADAAMEAAASALNEDEALRAWVTCDCYVAMDRLESHIRVL